MSTIDFSHLRLIAVFSTVVESSSFAAAARRLHSSRSRISEQVSQLEGVLGVRLLQRSTRQLIITNEGHLVYEQARKLPQILSEIEAIVTPAEPSGRVAITMNHDIAHKYILPVLEEFQQRYPKIQLDLILSDDRLDLIAEQIDLGIRIGLPRDNSLIARIMHEEQFNIFSSPRYLSKVGTLETISELEKCCWITLAQDDDNDLLRFRQNNKSIDIRPNKQYRCNSPFMMQQMIITGLGIGALLPSLVRDERFDKSLVNVMPSITSDPLVFSLVYPSRRQVPKRTRVLIDYLLDSKLFNKKSALK